MPRIFVAMLALSLVAASARPAAAIKQFSDQFLELYVETSEDDDFKELVGKAKCLVCHQGKKKKNRNAYGQALGELLDRKTDKKDVEKIVAALKEVAEMPSVADDEESPTFGELIAEGKLPGGDLEDLKQEPQEKEGSGGGDEA